MIKYIKFLLLTLLIMAIFVGAGITAYKSLNMEITYVFSIASMAVASTLLADNILKDKREDGRK